MNPNNCSNKIEFLCKICLNTLVLNKLVSLKKEVRGEQIWIVSSHLQNTSYFTTVRRFHDALTAIFKTFPLPWLDSFKGFPLWIPREPVNPDLLHKQRDHLNINQTGLLIKVFNQAQTHDATRSPAASKVNISVVLKLRKIKIYRNKKWQNISLEKERLES